MTLRTLSWTLAGVVVFIAAYALFAWWGANAESLGRHDVRLAIFFAFSSAYALIACMYLAPVCALLAVVAWLTRKGAALACLVAALASALPFVILG